MASPDVEQELTGKLLGLHGRSNIHVSASCGTAVRHQKRHAHSWRALPAVTEFIPRPRGVERGDRDSTLGLRIALVCLHRGFAWPECITIVDTSHDSGMAIGMMYAAQKMRKRAMFSSPSALRFESRALLLIFPRQSAQSTPIHSDWVNAERSLLDVSGGR